MIPRDPDSMLKETEGPLPPVFSGYSESFNTVCLMIAYLANVHWMLFVGYGIFLGPDREDRLNDLFAAFLFWLLGLIPAITGAFLSLHSQRKLIRIAALMALFLTLNPVIFCLLSALRKQLF
ncbi:hypothetical protein BH11PLA2_BH11PLA2_15320 [soil metagenome]